MDMWKNRENFIIGIDEVGRAASKRRASPHYIIGIDEVGRGPLAGPVTVAAVALSIKLKTKNLKLKTKLRDSKKLSHKQRERWFQYIIKESELPYATASVSPKIIDIINISKAANLAATRAFIKLTKNYKLKTKSCNIFLDGGLYLNKQTLVASGYWLNPKTIIKGDEKIPSIALASIIAKVTRDRLMKKLHKKYPRYGFDKHKGYGTKQHIKTIKKHGRSPIHRKSFKIKLLKSG